MAALVSPILALISLCFGTATRAGGGAMLSHSSDQGPLQRTPPTRRDIYDPEYDVAPVHCRQSGRDHFAYEGTSCGPAVAVTLSARD